MMLVSLLLGCLLLFIVYIHLVTLISRRKYKHIPSHPIPLQWHWFLGHSMLVKKNMMKLGTEGYDYNVIFEGLRKALETDTTVFFFHFKNIIYSIRLPVVAKVFSDHSLFKKPKRSQMEYLNGVRIFGTKGLLNEPGTEVWYRKRKIMDPAFKKQFLMHIMGDINASANNLCQFINNNQNKKCIEVYSVMMRVALEVVCTGGFNLRRDFILNENSDLNNATSTLFSVIATASLNFVDFWVPWKYRAEKNTLRESCSLLRSTMRQHLSMRIKELEDNPECISTSILDHIIRGNIDSNEISMEGVIDDFFAFMIAGMETTAITMSILIWLLLKNPDVFQKVITEVNEAFGDKEDLEFEDLPKLVYLEQCIKECLRLHPPAQMTTRVNSFSDVTVDGIFIPKGTVIMLPIENIQVSEKYWKDAHKFNPDRFASSEKIEPFTFMPFTAGPRICIGKNFAMMEAKVVLAKLFHTFQIFDPFPEERKLEKLVTLTAKPKKGVFIGITN